MNDPFQQSHSKKRMKFIDFNIRYCKNKWQYSSYSKLFMFAIRGCCTSLKKVMSSLTVKRYSELPSISFKGSKLGDVQNLFRENVFYCMKIIIYFQMRDLASFWTKKHAWGNSKKGVNMQWLLKYLDIIIAYCVARPLLSYFVTFCIKRKGNYRFLYIFLCLNS